MSYLLPKGKQQFTDNNGKPLANGKVYHYFVGTNNPKDTFQDANLTIPNTNPTILNARGEASIYGSGNYRQVLHTSTGVLIWDQVIIDAGLSASADVDTLRADLANSSDPSKGAGMVGFKQDDTLAAPSSVQIKLRRSLDIMDWPVSDAVGFNNTSMIQAAITKAATHPSRELVINGGVYGTGLINMPNGVRLIVEEGCGFEPLSSGGDCLRAYGALPLATFPLLADAPRGTDRLNVGATNAAAFKNGDYIWISDTALILTSPNTQNLTQAQLAKVLKVDSGLLILDRIIQYTFTISASAVVGVMTAARDITVEGLRFHDREYAVQTGRAIDFRFGNNIKVFDTWSDRSRSQPDPSADFQITARSAITLRSVSNVTVERLRAAQVAWYGVDLDGASHTARITDLSIDIARHGISLNWNGPGEPIDVLVENVVSARTTYGGADTHDVGRDITFRKIKTVGALNDGFQIRTSNVRAENIHSEYCGGHGVLVYGNNDASQTRITDIVLDGVRANNNAGRGITSVAACTILDARITSNGDTYHVQEKAGIATPGGRIADSFIQGNNGAAIVYFPNNVQAANKQRLRIDSVLANASGPQDVFLYSTQSYQDADIRIRDCVATGYSFANRIVRASGTFLGDIDERGCSWADAVPRCDTVILVAGTATVNNGHVRATTPFGARDWRSKISIRRITAGGTVGSYTVSMADGSFTITSSSPTDTSRIEWTIE
ncbi:hypothetical protein D3C78_666540 [compost metagenome]